MTFLLPQPRRRLCARRARVVFSAPADWGTRGAKRYVLSGRQPIFQHPLSRVLERDSGSPLLGGGFRRLRAAGRCACAARAHKEEATCGFLLLVKPPLSLGGHGGGCVTEARLGERQYSYCSAGSRFARPCSSLRRSSPFRTATPMADVSAGAARLCRPTAELSGCL